MISRFKPQLGVQEFLALFRRNTGAVKKFEHAFAKEFDAVDAVAFPYGRSALWAFLNAVGVKNYEVVMPAYTCSVVAHAVSLSGNKPRFVDIQLSDYNMNLDLLPTAINENTRAIVATHLFGYPSDINRVEAIVAEAEAQYGHKIWLIQDCAHSFGATWQGQLVGSSGDVGLYALNISKTMTAIFGGILTFQDQKLANKVREWRDQHFCKPGIFKPWLRRLYLLAVYFAFNKYIYSLTKWLQHKTPLLDKLTKFYHLDGTIHFPPDYLDKMLDIEAAVGLEQLKKYPMIINQRRKIATRYDQCLPRKDGWIFPPIIKGATYSHYVIRVPNRQACIIHMAKNSVELGELIQYSVPNLPGYSNIVCDQDDCSRSDMASGTTVNIPIYPGFSQKKLQEAIDAI